MGSLKKKLLFWMLPPFLVALISISIFSYREAKYRITHDRIVLYLEQIAKDIADTIQLTLLEKEEETISMTLYREFHGLLMGDRQEDAQALLNNLVRIHEVYDVLILFDVQGRFVISSSVDRTHGMGSLDPKQLRMITGENLRQYHRDSTWLKNVRGGRFGYLDWHQSDLVLQLYGYLDIDKDRQYSIGFSAPLFDEKGLVLGGILALMNWEYIQEILDKVEEDLNKRSLLTGYAFLFGKDVNTVIGHKYRGDRDYGEGQLSGTNGIKDNYGTRLIEDHHLEDLQRAVIDGATHFEYEYPPGTEKISGLAMINHKYFRWVCGVGIDNEEIFEPVQDLKKMLILAAVVLAGSVTLLTYAVARQITIPLKRLTRGASVISAGDFSQRVEVDSRDEIGELAQTFNEMANSLEERSKALMELNKKLEQKVGERTHELEETNQEVKKAYQELKDTQVQLIQSEKMASLGQLVAGIAHEIKNPLNFIYGNTDFLKKYVGHLKNLVELYEDQVEPGSKGEKRTNDFREKINYSFLSEDLDILIGNFEEGAKRIHSIIGDLRTFSRMDAHDFRLVDLHEPIDLALNLLHNEYRDRIRIHKEYGSLPELECHPGKISQVFMNLLSNACYAISKEGDIWIRTYLKNSTAVVEIEDTGVGIEDEHLGKLFEPFFTTKPVGKGTGLGLSIIYGIIQQHRGNIEVESQVNKGTRFTVHLPLSP